MTPMSLFLNLAPLLKLLPPPPPRGSDLTERTPPGILYLRSPPPPPEDLILDSSMKKPFLRYLPFLLGIRSNGMLHLEIRSFCMSSPGAAGIRFYGAVPRRSIYGMSPPVPLLTYPRLSDLTVPSPRGLLGCPTPLGI